MKKKGKIDLDIFDQVKQRKKSEILGYLAEKGAKDNKKILTENRIVVEISEDKSKYYIKKIDFRKEKIKKLKSYFFVGLFISMLGCIAFLSKQYLDYQYYLLENEEVVRLSNKYLELQRMKEQELKDIKDVTLNNIENLPENRKNLLLNIIPSGKPLAKDSLYVTSPFGMRTHPVDGGVKGHRGIDIRLNIGDDVIAPAMGKVSFAGDRNGYGKTIIIEHGYGFKTLYAHLDQIYVKEGEIVGKDKIIAAGGNTGKSTGPHLHYEVIYNDNPIDPDNFIKWDSNNFSIVFNNEKNVQWEYFLTIMGKN